MKFGKYLGMSSWARQNYAPAFPLPERQGRT